jgi:hypothetical protein
VPGFAAGGDHAGGLRRVGEHGPELEYTGPSHIFSAPQSRAMTGGGGDSLVAELVAEVKALRAENTLNQRAIAGFSAKTVRLLDRWEGEGMPIEREVVT